jgi:ABC-2 type transport system ATP-binding protein
MTTLLRISELRKKYRENIAVDGISFDVQKGETFGLLGPNGAGKTTTLSMVVGVLDPDEGQIEINGNPDFRHSQTRRQIGVAPQALSLYEEMTAEENLAFFGRLYGLFAKKLKERVSWALSFAGLEDRKADRVKTFSGGMKRRLNLACAFVHEPPLLLLDEPTVGVDPQSRNHIFESIESLKQRGITVIYTTHYMEEAQRLCDRVAIMDKGKILALNTVDNLIEQHGSNSVVEATLESPPESPLDLPGELRDSTLRVETDRPFEVIAQLSRSGLKFLNLKVDRADLESVFLDLTGRSLRDK